MTDGPIGLFTNSIHFQDRLKKEDATVKSHADKDNMLKTESKFLQDRTCTSPMAPRSMHTAYYETSAVQ